MSTELNSNTKGVGLTRFWGGEHRKSCILVSRRRDIEPSETPFEDWNGSISLAIETKDGAKEVRAFAELLLELSKDDMITLANDLLHQINNNERN
jgi:hypothetical protein